MQVDPRLDLTTRALQKRRGRRSLAVPTLQDDIDQVIVDPRTYGDEHAYHRAFAQLRAHD